MNNGSNMFESLGQCDIWSISGIQYGSSINDILDKEQYTLEELLQEDELLQEIKSKNDRLITFLSSSETVEKLLDFIINPAYDTEELRAYKYPYMSCEVFCCEVPEMLETLVNYDEEKYLKKLFSFLDKDDSLDCYLAGYFEKVLEMLFRRTTTQVIGYINYCGIALFKRFIHHIDNYSITHIVQRLMLPHIPFVQVQNYDSDIMKENEHEQQCNWSFSEETCALLCSYMSKAKDPDVPSHISDLIITVLQLSPPDTAILTYLCQSMCIESLLSCAFYNLADCELEQHAAHLSISLASISVLESLISRLCESLVSYDDSQNSPQETDLQLIQQTKDDVEKICQCIHKYLPELATQLSYYNESSPSGEIFTQSKALFPRVGHRCLLLVKFVESIIRVHDPLMDKLLCESGVLKISLDLMFTFELNSLLHLSVQRIILLIIDGGDLRRSVQHYMLVECGLLNRIIETIEEGNKPKVYEKSNPLAGCRRPVLGHLLLIAQTLYTIDTETENHKINANDSSISNSNENKQEKDDGIFMRQTLGDIDLFNKWEDFLVNVFDPIMVKLADSQTASDVDFIDEYIPQGHSDLSVARHRNYDDRTFDVSVEVEGEEFDDDDDDFNEKPTPIENNFADFASFDSFNNSAAPPAESSSSGADPFASNSFDPFASNSSNPLL